MGMFDGMNDPSIPVGGQRIYFSGGSYRVKIDVLKSIDPSEAFDGIGSYIAELVVINSTNPTLQPGAVVGWVEKLKKKYIRKSFANIKGFLACAFGVESAAFDTTVISLGYVHAVGHQMAGQADFERFTLDMASEANPLAGQVLDLVCTEKPKKESEGIFTVHHWHVKGFLNDVFGPPA